MHSSFLDLMVHLDDHLRDMIIRYGTTIYGILFGVIFVETGLVVTPFLPGDSLLFASGLMSRPEQGLLNVWILILGLPVAAVLGDLVNFHIGVFFGHLLHKPDDTGILKKRHLEKTRAFFETHGSKAIVIGRFVPVVRTVAPFVAGLDGMPLRWFFPLSVIAAITWVFSCVGFGFLLGGIPFVRAHFSVALLAVVAISVLGFVAETLRHRGKAARKSREQGEPGAEAL